MDEYLRSTAVMDYDHPEARSLARGLADGVSDPTTIARRSFEWVRDEIRHSGDFQVNQPTCAASEVHLPDVPSDSPSSSPSRPHTEPLTAGVMTSGDVATGVPGTGRSRRQS